MSSPSSVDAGQNPSSAQVLPSPAAAHTSAQLWSSPPTNQASVVGDDDGLVVGLVLGDVVGEALGLVVGLTLGLGVGEELGLIDGDELGDALGFDDEGDPLGDTDGIALGAAVGLVLGETVGATVLSQHARYVPDDEEDDAGHSPLPAATLKSRYLSSWLLIDPPRSVVDARFKAYASIHASDVEAHMTNRTVPSSSMNAGASSPGLMLRILMHLLPSSNALPLALHPLPPSVAIAYSLGTSGGAPVLATSGPPQLISAPSGSANHISRALCK